MPNKITLPKITVQASPDVAFIKYWGKKNEIERIPENGSISMILSGLHTTTTVEFSEKLSNDKIIINGKAADKETKRVTEHLDRIRNLARVTFKARVVSENNFPESTGLSSSSSGFAALTIAATLALALDLSEPELSILARQASGSACRCVCGGIVEWIRGETSSNSYAQTIFPADYWDLRDIVVVINSEKKKISSTAGHITARSSIFFETRQKNIQDKIEKMKKIIAKKDFASFGELLENECLEFHSILFTSQPPLIMWQAETLALFKEVMDMRNNGLPAYVTINTGHNVHIITLPKYQKDVMEKIKELNFVKKILLTKIGGKPVILDEHLF